MLGRKSNVFDGHDKGLKKGFIVTWESQALEVTNLREELNQSRNILPSGDKIIVSVSVTITSRYVVEIAFHRI